MDPPRPVPRAWTPMRIVLTVLGVVCLVVAAGLIAYGFLLFVTIILIPVGLALMAVGIGLGVAGLLLVASPWVHYWWQRRKARKAMPEAQSGS